MPHVIISGMPGIGKTTSVLCLARQLLGDTYKEAVLELNASDERGNDNRYVLCLTHPILTLKHRNRRRSQSHQGLRAEEGYPAPGPPQARHPRRGR